MQLTGEYFFSAARFTLDENRQPGPSNLPDPRLHLLYLWIDADKGICRRGYIRGLPPVIGAMKNPVQHSAQFLTFDRLAKKIRGAAFHSRHGFPRGRLAGDKNYGQSRVDRMDFPQRVETVSIRHLHVEQNRGKIGVWRLQE